MRNNVNVVSWNFCKFCGGWRGGHTLLGSMQINLWVRLSVLKARTRQEAQTMHMQNTCSLAWIIPLCKCHIPLGRHVWYGRKFLWVLIFVIFMVYNMPVIKISTDTNIIVIHLHIQVTANEHLQAGGMTKNIMERKQASFCTHSRVIRCLLIKLSYRWWRPQLCWSISSTILQDMKERANPNRPAKPAWLLIIGTVLHVCCKRRLTCTWELKLNACFTRPFFWVR